VDQTNDLDEWAPLANGLFRLVRGGTATPVTSYVDPAAPAPTQMEQLGRHAGWLPYQVLAETAARVQEQGIKAPSEITETHDGRLFPPAPHRDKILVASGESADDTGLRSYLWPVVNDVSQLVMEPGEQWEKPEAWISGPGFEHAGLAMPLLTDRRLVVMAAQELPSHLDSDSNAALGLVSSSLDDALGMLKQMRRKGEAGQRCWVHHVRYEWLTSVAKSTKVFTKKKVFGGGRGVERTNTSFSASVRGPFGKQEYVGLGGFEDGALERLRNPEELAAKAASYEAQLRRMLSGRGLVFGAPEVTTSEVDGGTVTREVWTMDPLAARAFPSELSSL